MDQGVLTISSEWVFLHSFTLLCYALISFLVVPFLQKQNDQPGVPCLYFRSCRVSRKERMSLIQYSQQKSCDCLAGSNWVTVLFLNQYLWPRQWAAMTGQVWVTFLSLKLEVKSRGDYCAMHTIENEMGGESIFQEEKRVSPTRSRANVWCAVIKPSNTTIL